jgi:hypothetical protein
MVMVAKLLPDIQNRQLNELRSEVDKRKSQTGVSAEVFNFPLKPDTFPFSSQPRSNAAMKYGYGALPLVDMRPKQSQQLPASSSASSGSASGSKKNKKGKK